MNQANPEVVEDVFVPDQDEQTPKEVEVDVIEDAFVIGHANEMEDDAIKMDMIKAGAKFSNVTRLFNQYMIDHGLAMSKEDRDGILSDILTDIDLTDEGQLDAAVADVESQIKNATAKSAIALIRLWAKNNDVEVYKKPKGVARTGYKSKLYDALVANPRMTDEQIVEFTQEAGSANDMKNIKYYKGVRDFATRIASL